MKINKILYRLIIVLINSLAISSQTYAQPKDLYEIPQEVEDKTLSPYFFVRSANDNSEAFPLKSTQASVNIVGIIADVVVTQSYKNDGDTPIEATYVFPASTRAAVYAMRMKIGERITEAKIKERSTAKREYEEAKNSGKSASLLEQNRPNVFQMNVANIMPGDLVEVELRYTEIISSNQSTYEFTYPTVVGPRYSNQTTEQANIFDQWVKNPFLHSGEAPNYSFEIEVGINGGMPIKEVVSETHNVDVAFDSPSDAKIKIQNSDKQKGNKDFILKYKLAGDVIDTGVSLYEGDSENFFLVNIQPPARITKDQISPRDYIFVVDVSGSMNGFPLNTTKTLLKNLIGNLRITDKFNLILFSGDSSSLSDKSLPATEENILRAISLIEDQHGSGATEIVPALKRCYNLPREDNLSRSIVIITDGYVNVEKEVFKLISDNLNKANVFSFGIGSSVNRYLIDGIARAGGGEPFVLTRPSQAAEVANKFKSYIDSPVLTSVSLKIDGANLYDLEPTKLPDLFAEKPIYLFGKYRGKPHGKIQISGTGGEGTFSKIIDLSEYVSDKENVALKYLWARHRIAELSDYNKVLNDSESVQEIIKLGLAYNLLTEHTSFIAVDHKVINSTGEYKSVKQPLPLPEGVGDFAIGGGIPSAPEPETWAILLVASIVLSLIALRRPLSSGYIGE